MGLGKQAKILTPAEVGKVLRYVDATSKNPARDRLAVLLTHRAGLRACEVAALTWDAVTDASGEIGDVIHLVDGATKGAKGGRIIPTHPDIREALAAWRAEEGSKATGERRIMQGQRGAMTADGLVNWFLKTYAQVGLKGASSHSGRRTFVTRAAKKVVEAGGSLRDVQQLAGHASLQTTQRYIEGDSEAKRKLIALL